MDSSVNNASSVTSVIQGNSKLLSGFPWRINGNPDNNSESSCIIIVIIIVDDNLVGDGGDDAVVER
jgi:hypothetical protein